MKKLNILMLIALAFISNVALAATTEIAANVITIKVPVIDNKITAHGQTEVFMELINKGNKAHTIIAATSPAARQVQLHKTLHHGKQDSMQQIPTIVIKKHNETNLHLGGLHVMCRFFKLYPCKQYYLT